MLSNVIDYLPPPQVAAAGDDAAGLEQPLPEAFLTSSDGGGPVPADKDKGHGGDAAAGGWLRVEKRMAALKSVIGAAASAPRTSELTPLAPPSTALVPAAKNNSSVQRFSEQVPDGIVPERVNAAVMPSTASGSTASVSAAPGSTATTSSGAMGVRGGAGPTAAAGETPGSLTAAVPDSTGAPPSARSAPHGADSTGAPPSARSVPHCVMVKQLSTSSHGTTAPRTSSNPGSPQPGLRSLGSVVSVAGMLSPGRLPSASSIAHYPASPTRLAKAANLGGTLSPRPAYGPAPVMSTSGSAGSSASSAQARAQAPPALTPRQLNVGSFVPQAQGLRAPSPATQPQATRAPSPPVVGAFPASASRPTPVSPARIAPRSISPTPLSTGGMARGFPAGALQQFSATRQGGIVPETMSGGSFSAPNAVQKGRVITGYGGTGGSFELPVGGSFVPRTQSTSPSHRPRSPSPHVAMQGAVQMGLPPGAQVGMPAVRTGTPGRLQQGFRPTVGPSPASVTGPVWR